MRFFILFFLLCFYHVQSQNDSLIAEWNFNNENCYDQSSSLFHGIPYGDYTYVDGIAGKAIRFKGLPGNSGNGGHMIIPMIDFKKYSEFSINLWVRQESNSNEGCYFLFFGDLYYGFLGLGYHVNRPNKDYSMNYQWAVGAYERNDKYYISPIQLKGKGNNHFNEWVNMTLVFKNGNISSWFNDELVGTKKQDILIYGNYAALNKAWWNQNVTATRFTASYDEVKIFSKALTECEIKELAGVPCQITDPCDSDKTFLQSIESDQFEFVNNVVTYDSTIRVTKNDKYQRGAFWTHHKYNLSNDFTVDFSVKLSLGDNLGQDESSNPGADGFAFVIQNESIDAIGKFGGGIGYEGIKNSIAFEFDLFQNKENDYDDPNGYHFAVFSNGLNPNTAKHSDQNSILAYEDLPVDPIVDGREYEVHLDYSANESKLFVYFNEKGTSQVLLKELDINLSQILQSNDDFHFGITSATGSAVQKHEITNFKVCSDLNTTNIDENSYFNNSGFIITTQLSLDPSIFRYESVIRVIDVTGQNVTNLTDLRNVQQGKIDVSLLNKGIYFIQIINEHESHSIKFIKD